MTTVDDLLITSPDLRKERLEELQRLFPDLFSEDGQLNTEALEELIDEEATPTRERYEFNWNGKTRAKRHAFTPSRAALTYDPERSVNPEKAGGNLIIEGENLELLKLLSAAYREQVKGIYIDPPYNTGGDFIYPDNYAQDRKAYWEESGAYENGVRMDTNPDTSGRYHSDWLSMMYSRLLVARQLLREDGAIFISIDNNEVHNLRKMLDEIFGEENFVEQFIWRARLGKGGTSSQTATIHEYILCYAKDATQLGLEAEERISTGGKERLRQWGQGDRREDRPTMFFPVLTPEGKEVLPIKPDGSEGRWRVGPEKMRSLQDEGLVIFEEQDDGRIEAYRIIPEGKATYSAIDSILPKEIGTTASGSIELKKIFGEKLFDYPKPSSLIEYLFGHLEDAAKGLFLDFFAGSGTTAQAVMNLNQKDGGSRSFVLVQLPEAIEKDHDAFTAGYKKISDVCIDRCKKVIEGYGDDPQPVDTGFKVYQLTKSHFPRVEFQPDPDKTPDENVELLKRYIAEKEGSFQLAFEQDKVLDEVLLKHGFMLNYSLTKVVGIENNTVYLAQDNHREALICLDLSIDGSTVDYFKQHTDKPFICLERALDTTKKWNLKHALGDRLKSI